MSLDEKSTDSSYNDAEFAGQGVDKTQAQAELVEPASGERVYSQARAEYLLRIAAAMYSRDASAFASAQKIYRVAVPRDGQPLPSEPVLNKPEFGTVRTKIRRELFKSEGNLRRYADELGLNYQTVSELNTGQGGPFASMFWNKSPVDGSNFIIVAVKGTQPLDVREWLIDAGCQKVNMHKRFYPYLPSMKLNKDGAQAHEGFYYSLFPDRNRQAWNWLYQGVYANDATQSIVNQVNAKVAEFNATVPAGATPPKTYLWVCGHSLGAAIASLLYARLLVADTLSPDVELRDAYTFGTPMNTDLEFVSLYRQWMSGSNVNLQTPTNNLSRYNFRIINNNDVVPLVPPTPNLLKNRGVGEIEALGKTYTGSLLDYAGIGLGIRYTNDGNLPEGLDKVKFRCNGLEVSAARPTAGFAGWLEVLERSRFNPFSGLTDHACLAYQTNLSLARKAMIAHQSANGSVSSTASSP